MNYFHKANIYLEQQVNSFFSNLDTINKTKYGGVLSVILLGSLSRGEGSWTFDGNNRVILLSDIEFLVIHPDGFKRSLEFTHDSNEAMKSIFEDGSSPLFHVDYSFCSVSNVKRLEKKLLIFDAIEMGKTISGDNKLDLFPTINIRNINLVDIHDILIHRVFSVLYYGVPLKKANRLEEYRYSIAKNSLDLMTVILVNNGRLVSGFQRRLAVIQDIAIDERIKKYFIYCLKVKFSEDTAVEFSIEEMENYFIEIVQELDLQFEYHLSNTYSNIISITRRKLGILKRGIMKNNIRISQKRHLSRLISEYKNGIISDASIRNNYVLNGYPSVEHR